MIRKQLVKQGYVGEIFIFVDASHLIAKANLWKERDKAIEKKYEKLNNEVLPKVAYDKEARIGCKGKKKYWYGYKKHVTVYMKNGIINKIRKQTNKLNDYEKSKIIVNQIKSKEYTQSDLDEIIAEIKELYKSDGVFDSLEQSIFSMLNRLLKIN